MSYKIITNEYEKYFLRKNKFNSFITTKVFIYIVNDQIGRIQKHKF